MSEVSDNVDSMARKSLTTILNAAEKRCQNTVVEELRGGRFDHHRRQEAILAALRQDARRHRAQVVPVTARCYISEEIKPLPAAAPWGKCKRNGTAAATEHSRQPPFGAVFVSASGPRRKR